MLSIAFVCAACAKTTSKVETANVATTAPAPASTRCWIYDNIYPATRAAFEREHVTPPQELEIEYWASPSSPAQDRAVKARSPWTKPPSPAEAHLVWWLRDPRDHSIFIFVKRPLCTAGESGHRPWIALNTNVMIDPLLCDVGAYPTA